MSREAVLPAAVAILVVVSTIAVVVVLHEPLMSMILLASLPLALACIALWARSRVRRNAVVYVEDVLATRRRLPVRRRSW